MISISSRSCVASSVRPSLLVDVEQFVTLLDHLAHDVEDVGVTDSVTRSAPPVFRWRTAALTSRSVETRRAWPAFIASFKALLISSRNTSFVLARL